MNRMNKLNHFTTYEVLLKILKDGLRFSPNFDNWDDKNDSKLVNIYKEIHPESNIGIICFLNDDETIYHWTYFSKNTCLKEVCCIEFNKNDLLKNTSEKHKYQEIQYDTLNDVKFDQPEELLFTKRWPYRNERESRIVRLYGNDEFLTFEKNVIQKITLSGALSKEEFCQRKDYLRKKYKLICEINQSTIFENEKWINKAMTLKYKIEKKPIVKGASKHSQQEKENIKALVKSGKEVNINYFDIIWDNGSIIATINKDDKLIGCGALKNPIKTKENNHTKNVFNQAKSQLNFDNFKYELGWLVTEQDYRGRGLCSAIVEKLLEYNGDKPIYATVRQQNFSMRKILEFFDFCISGEPYQGNGDYKVLLYVRNI